MADNKTNMVGNEIIFRMGEETGIVIEKTKEQFEQSIFKEQYKQALLLANDIMSIPDNYDENAPESNIIAFCGERGEGKTSALMSIRNILADSKAFNAAKEANLFPEKHEIKETSFKVLNLVDPAFFDGHHNILELLLGQMYAEVLSENEIKNNTSDCDFKLSDRITDRNRLMQHFYEVRSSLSIINKPSNTTAYDNLEEIDELAAGIVLKKKFNILLHCYAKYFNKERVLICIDDLDLNVSEGYKMAEEIRKYLCSPSECIVLIAIKVEQMIDVVKSYLRKCIDMIVIDAEITDMATRYVTKLIPESHRVIMPKGQSIVQKPLTIIDREVTAPYDSVKEAVVRLIYLKTRYIFVNGRNLSAIVPTNLRSLRHLIALLWYMPDAKKNNNADNKENKEKFKNYFYRSWGQIISKKDKKFVSELVDNENITAINKFIIQHLKKVITNVESLKDDLLKSIIDEKNQIQNISTGDVFYVIRYIESIDTNADTTNLLFFIKAFYSIKLYESYDYISIDLWNLYITPHECLIPKNDKRKKLVQQNEPSIYKYDVQLRQLNLLQRLLNGGYFTYKQGSLIPDEKGGNTRDVRLINGTKLREVFEKISNKDTRKEDKIVYLNICEFFALTTIRSSRHGAPLVYNRQQSGRAYFDEYNSNRNYFVFDVLSIFYNIVNIQQTYKKWDQVFKGDFFEFAYKEQGSLLNAILKDCKRPYKNADSTLPSNIHHFISDSTIRFSELMLSIIDNALNQRNIYSEGGNANNLKIFYDNLLKIGITLYPLDPNNEKDKGYSLEFIFLKKTKEFLNEIKIAKDKLRKESNNENVDIKSNERLLAQTFDDIYGNVDSTEETKEDEDETSHESEESTLDYIFRNSLAKKNVRYPKTKDKVIDYLKYNEKLLYKMDTEFWVQIIDNKTYLSWQELKDVLNLHIARIVDMYKNVKQTN